jgi:hypothetical protein
MKNGAYFGSPVIDGKVDGAWSKAQVFTPKFVTPINYKGYL